jgi:hypothetical protein
LGWLSETAFAPSDTLPISMSVTAERKDMIDC